MQLLYTAMGLIVLVLLWQGGQWLLDQRQRLRVKLEKVPPGPDIDIRAHAELGEVRVRPRLQPVTDSNPVLAADDDVPVLTPADAGHIATAAPLMAEDTVAVAHDDAALTTAFTEATAPAEIAPAAEENAAVPPLAVAQTEQEDLPVLLTPGAVERMPPMQAQHDMFADEPVALPPGYKAGATRPNRASALYEKAVAPVQAVSPREEKPPVPVEDFIAVHVLAREQLFNGEDLLRHVLSYGLRYGDMAIFHRHEQPSGQGRILFSMAKAVEPGTFDLETMTGEELPGVSFFLGLPGVNSIHAFDIMMDTAKRLALELQGDMLDAQQQPLTRQLIEHYRERVQEFERRRLMARQAGH